MQKECSIEAIIMKSIPFKENKVILHLFSSELGLISAISSVKKKAYLSSMMVIQATVKKGKGDLYSISERHIIDTFSNLREDFSLLQISMKMMNLLSQTLVKDRAIKPIYLLTKNTLKAFTKNSNQNAIYVCFILKLLLFEGLLPLDSDCVSKEFSEEEKEMYLTIATAKKFADLNELSITPQFSEVIENYLTCAIG